MATTPEHAARSQRDLIDAAWRQLAPTIPTAGRGPDNAPGRLPAVRPEPDAVPGYRLIGEIHRGGQGVVYKAVQETTDRLVAIKLMREGPFATADDRARFEREVRILGLLRHPGIVAIHHSGALDGRFYYVMDYIDGLPLDEYVRERRPPVRELMHIFARICGAVAAAHQLGVIHRDLKPSNIRVDSAGEPHVLDFGLSRMAGDGEASSMTTTGQFVGSAPWASPEQAAGETDTLDVRTDVYAIGVLMFEMLTGDFPYPVRGRISEVMDHIRTTPARPVRNLRPDVPRDVETLVAKCLQKERERRYPSAIELGRDLERYLRHEPLEARRDSITYTLSRQLMRHRLAASVILAFVLLITVGFAVSATLWRQAASARDAQEEMRRTAERNEKLAVEQAALAASKAEQAQAINRFLEEMLTAADPRSGEARNVTAREVLDRAAQRLADGFLDRQPEVEAAVRVTMGNAYRALGDYEMARVQLRAAESIRRDAAGEGDEELIRTMLFRGRVLLDLGEHGEAERIAQNALDMRRRQLRAAPAPESPEMDDAILADCLGLLGHALEQQGRLDEAEPPLRQSLAMRRALFGDIDLDVATGLSRLSALLSERGDYAAAESLQREVVAIQEALLPEHHVERAAALNNLALLQEKQDHFDEAESNYRHALEVLSETLDSNHPDISAARNNLGLLLWRLEQYAEAEPLLRDALDQSRKTFGDEHELTIKALNNLALVREGMKDYAGAEPLFAEAVALSRKTMGDRHAMTAVALHNHSRVLERLDCPEEAIACSRESVEILRQALGDRHPNTLNAVARLGGLYARQEAWAEAEAPYRLAVEISTNLRPAGDAELANPRLALGKVLMHLERFDEAEAHLKSGYDILLAASGESADSTRNAAARLADLYEAWNRPEDASLWRSRANAADEHNAGDENNAEDENPDR